MAPLSLHLVADHNLTLQPRTCSFRPMDISRYAVGAEDIDALSTYQVTNFFRLHKSITKDECDRAGAKVHHNHSNQEVVQYNTRGATIPLLLQCWSSLRPSDLSALAAAR